MLAEGLAMTCPAPRALLTLERRLAVPLLLHIHLLARLGMICCPLWAPGRDGAKQGCSAEQLQRRQSVVSRCLDDGI
jgi:hypothetical protein